MNRAALGAFAVCVIAVAGCTLEAPREPVEAEPVVVSVSSPAASPSAGDEETATGFATAGVCARCHVRSVVEWSVSAHVVEETTCQECHGDSRAHVANERNEVKPDRRPTGAKIARLCMDCHDEGCPSTTRRDDCQSCHHVHALLDPTKPASGTGMGREELLERWLSYQQSMDEGERFAADARWPAAHEAFLRAVSLVPSSLHARERVAACRRRLEPEIPGFEAVGDVVDGGTGLPHEVKVIGTDLRLLLVPGGDVDLGNESFPSARPVHTVAVESYYLGKFEITQAQWERWMGENPSYHGAGRFPGAASMPVERVSWEDCQRFVARLNEVVPGAGFRLPTEAEWEHAARGDGPAELALEERAVFRHAVDSSAQDDAFRGIDAYAPRAVGSKRAERRGFYDLFGNVNEWCADRFVPYVLGEGDGTESHRVLRGGSYADSASVLDPGFRHRERPDRRLRYNGFRLARSIPTASEATEGEGRPDSEARQ